MSEDPPFLVTTFANRLSKPNSKAAESPPTDQATRPHREIGPLGMAARLLVGLLLVSLIVYGQLASSGHLAPVTWVLGLLGFPLSCWPGTSGGSAATRHPSQTPAL
jgi:hypothetical protein